MIYKSRNIYEGDWENDIQNGKGILIYKIEDNFEANFINGEMNGNGIFTWQNGEIYKRFYNKKIILRKLNVLNFA